MTAQPAWPLLPAWSSLRQVRSVRDSRGELLGLLAGDSPFLGGQRSVRTIKGGMIITINSAPRILRSKFVAFLVSNICAMKVSDGKKSRRRTFFYIPPADGKDWIVDFLPFSLHANN
jgi:hypothetical protein